MYPTQLPTINTPIAVDTETSGLYTDDGATTCVVSVAWTTDGTTHAHAWPFNQGPRNQPQQTLQFEPDPNLPAHQWVALIHWLSQHDLVMHNAKFDLHMLTTGTEHWPGLDLVDCVMWDTMVVNKELDPLHPTGLKPTAKRLGLGNGTEQQNIKNYIEHHKLPTGRYDLIPWDVMEPYATADAEMTIELYNLQTQRIADGELDPRMIERELEMMKTLYKIEQRGIAFDTDQCIQVAQNLMQHRTTIENTLPFEPTPTAARTYFYETLNLEPYQHTDTGKPKLDENALRKMAQDGVPAAAQYLQHRKLTVALDMWYLGYPNKIGNDGRLRTSYRQTKEHDTGGTVSGRFSVQRINLQAIPHKSKLTGLPEGTPTPRQFFHPKPGHELWELDLQQAELRVAARMANCTRMLQLIEQDADLHSVTARELFGATESDPDWFKYRQISKRGNFSLIFGVGPDTFRQTLETQAGIEMQRSEAADFIQAWRKLYPEYMTKIDLDSTYADRNGYIPTIGGRRRWFYPGEYTHKAFNQRVQGALAEFAKSWAIETEKQHPNVLVLLVHDSEVLEIEQQQARATVDSVINIGAEMGTRWFKVPMGVDANQWGEH